MKHGILGFITSSVTWVQCEGMIQVVLSYNFLNEVNSFIGNIKISNKIKRRLFQLFILIMYHDSVSKNLFVYNFES